LRFVTPRPSRQTEKISGVVTAIHQFCFGGCEKQLPLLVFLQSAQSQYQMI